MADFSKTDLTPIPVEATPKPGASSTSAIVGLDGLVSTVGNLASNLFKSFNEGKADGVVSNFSTEQLKIANAVAQGSISSSEGKSRMRANYSRYIGENPSLLKDITDSHKAIVSTAGLGKIVDGGTDAEKRIVAATDEATKAGFIPLKNPSEEDVNNGLANYEQFKLDERNLELIKSKLDLRTTKANVTKAELGARDAIDKAESKVAIGRIVNSYSNRFFPTIKSTVNEFLSTSKTPEQRTAALASLQSEFAIIQSNVAGISGDAGDYANMMIAPMKFAYESAVDVISGKTTLESYETSIKMQTAVVGLNVMGDPRIALAAGVSSVVKNMPLESIPALNDAVADMLIKNGNLKNGDKSGKVVDPLSSKEGDPSTYNNVDGYLKMLEGSIGAVNTNSASDVDGKTSKEINTNIINIAKGINAYKDSVETPDEYNRVVSFFASPSVGKFLQGQGGIPSDIASEMSGVISERYEQVVAPLIKERYSTGQLTVNLPSQPSPGSSIIPPRRLERQNASDVVEPVFSGGGVRFEPKPGIQGKVSQNELSDLNRSLTPINNLIRLYSHLNGTTDYRKSWEELKVRLFGEDKEKVGK